MFYGLFILKYLEIHCPYQEVEGEG